MAKLQVYKCEVCRNIVEVLNVGGGQLTCCNQAMTLMQENGTDAAQEKHVPVIEETPNGVKVKVGKVSHPMETAHYIEWIEVIAGEKNQRCFLKPNQAPEVPLDIPAEGLIARAYCNIHGLWRN